MSRCRACAGHVVWCLTTNGKRMPVNIGPDEGGNVIPRTVGWELIDGCHVDVDSGPELLDPPGLVRYTSHFATCPDADDFRIKPPIEVLTAQAARDEGVKRVTESADPYWVSAARDALYEACVENETFTTDQVWKILDSRYVVPPHEPRAMVAIVNYGKRKGWLQFSDPAIYLPSKRRKAHAGPKRVYESKMALDE